VSNKKKTSSTTTNSAATWAQPAITDSLSGLQSASQQSQANSSAVQPYLMQAIQNIGSGTPSYLQAGNNQLESTINGSGVGANQYADQLANSPYASQIAAAGATTNPYIDQLANGDNTYIDQLLSATSGTNPYAAAQAKQIADQTGAGLASSFGGAGRAGSGLASLLGAQGIGNALTNYYSNQYATDQGLRASALTNAAQLKQSGLSNAASLSSADANRNLSALQSAGQLSQQGTQAAASLRDAELARQQQAALGSGSQYAANLAGISPLLNLASTSTLLPLQGASAYSSGVTQATAPYATQQQNSTQTTGGLGSILGPALGLAGALATGGASSGLSGLLGGLGGGGAGGLLSSVPQAALPNWNQIGQANLNGLNFGIGG